MNQLNFIYAVGEQLEQLEISPQGPSASWAWLGFDQLWPVVAPQNDWPSRKNNRTQESTIYI